MPDGRLGLIDYGQTKVLTDAERLGVAKVVVALNREDVTSSASHASEVAQAMKELGFVTKLNDDKTLTSFAGLFFDSDVEGRERGLATPQLFFAELNKADPLVHVPDAASKYLMYIWVEPPLNTSHCRRNIHFNLRA